MKKILSVLAISLLAISMNAQNAFLNAGFETWTGGLPTNWNTLTIPPAGNLSNISKSTNTNSGSFAVKIAAKTLPVTISGMTTAPGLLTNGTLDVMGLAQMDYENIDFTQLSSLVNENYEQFIFATLVISNASGTREVVGIANYTNVPEFTGSMKATYASFESEITYLNPTATPTELVFLAITMNADLNATSFGYLLLDDVSIATQIGLEKITNDTKTPLVIYPNPTSGEFRLNVKSNVEVSVYNQLGQVVIPPMNYSPNTKVSVKEKGIYFVRIKDAKGTKTQKLIVK